MRELRQASSDRTVTPIRFERYEDENCIGSLSSVPCLSARDRAQLFALSTLALLISFLGSLTLAGALMALPWGFDAILKTLPHPFTLLAQTSSRGRDLFVLFWAAISGVLFVFGLAGRAAGADTQAHTAAQ